MSRFWVFCLHINTFILYKDGVGLDRSDVPSQLSTANMRILVLGHLKKLGRSQSQFSFKVKISLSKILDYLKMCQILMFI